MTAETDVGHGHGHSDPPQAPFPGFQPQGQYGVNALADQLRATRLQRDQAEDRAAFYEACLRQYMDQAGAEIQRLSMELSQALARLAEERARHAQDGVSPDSIDAELASMVSQDPPDEKADTRIDQVPPIVVSFDGKNGIPPAQEGIEPDPALDPALHPIDSDD